MRNQFPVSTLLSCDRFAPWKLRNASVYDVFVLTAKEITTILLT